MRKHLYLITEHENQGLEGNIAFLDERLSRVVKNEQGPIQQFNKNTGEFQTIGKQVGLGYYDFENQDQFEDNEYVQDVCMSKLREIDDKWIRKSGIESADWVTNEKVEE